MPASARNLGPLGPPEGGLTGHHPGDAKGIPGGLACIDGPSGDRCERPGVGVARHSS
jgi:hypothetical protein